MAPTDAADTVRVRVRAWTGLKRSGAGSSKTEECEQVVCAVGEIAAGGAIESVVWIRGGAKHDAVGIDYDASSDAKWIDVKPSTLYVKPTTVSDEAALWADDVAAMIHAAKVVDSRKLQSLAVFTTSKTASSAYLLVKILNKMYDATRQARPTISIVFMDGVPAMSSAQTQARAFSHDDALLKDSLQLDGCLDLCCSDSSIRLATRHVEPLGSLILLTPPMHDSHNAIAIDMNAVVVNELVLLSVGDYLEELPRALEFLAEQSAATA